LNIAPHDKGPLGLVVPLSPKDSGQPGLSFVLSSSPSLSTAKRFRSFFALDFVACFFFLPLQHNFALGLADISPTDGPGHLCRGLACPLSSVFSAWFQVPLPKCATLGLPHTVFWLFFFMSDPFASRLRFGWVPSCGA